LNHKVRTVTPKREAPRLGQVVGNNLERIRTEESWSQEDLAARGWRVGLPWSRSTIAAVEAGKRGVDLGEVVLLALVLDAPVSDLLSGSGAVQLGDGSRVSLSDIRRVLTGDASSARTIFPDVKRRIFAARKDAHDRVMLSASGEAEQKAARKLGVTPHVIAAAAWDLWRRSLTEERNARVDQESLDTTEARSSQALRGHVTRQLLGEIESLVEDPEYVKGVGG
jgi:transcriptional regulator with XRE-family HTH domain